MRNNVSMRLACALSAVAVIGGLAPVASATLIAYEGFAQAAGADLRGGAPSGTGFSTFGTTASGCFAPTANSPAMTYGALQTTGNALTYRWDIPDAGGSDSWQNNPLASTIPSGSVTYISMLIKAQTGGGDWGFSRIAGSAGPSNFAIGSSSGTYGLYDAGWNNVVASPVAVDANTHLIVLKIDQVSAGKPVTMWLDPTSLGGADPATSYATMNSNWASTINVVTLATNIERTRYDEIRVGTTYADVTPTVPEPASLGLLAIGSVSILRLRRRQA